MGLIHPGIDAVRKHLRVLPGHAVVEMHPEVLEKNGVHLLDKGTSSIRDAQSKVLRLATLLSPIDDSLPAGSTILMVPGDGKRISNFKLGNWQSDREVRLLGIVCERLGCPITMPLNETIMGKYNPSDGTYRPVLDNILLRLPDRLDKSDGGILLPDSLKARPTDIALVEAVGPNVKHVKAGDTVIYERRALFEIGFDGHEDLAFIVEDGIYTVYEVAA